MNNSSQTVQNSSAIAFLQHQPDLLANLLINRQLQLGDIEPPYSSISRNIAANASIINSHISNITAQGNPVVISNNVGQESLSTSREIQDKHDQQFSNGQHNFNANNISLLTTVPKGLHDSRSQTVYNIKNSIDRDMNHVHENESLDIHHQLPTQQEQIYQQQQQQLNMLQQHSSNRQHSIPALITQSHNINQQHYPTYLQLKSPPSSFSSMQSFYIPKESANGTTANMVPASSTLPSVHTITTPAAINICINNHYSDSVNTNKSVNSPPTSVATLAKAPPQQTSPIIPAINHKIVIDPNNGYHIDSYSSAESALIIDEPDSTTTTPNTPPENSSAELLKAEKVLPIIENATRTSCFLYNTKEDEESKSDALSPNKDPTDNRNSIQPDSDEVMLTTVSVSSTPIVTFNNGDSVLVKHHDGQYYLGTVMNSTKYEFLIRFDDKSELWCNTDEIRKQNNEDVVQICERCGHGYHRNYTNETRLGSYEYICKCCVKPMNVSVNEKYEIEANNIRSSSENDEKEKQANCYCGSTNSSEEKLLECSKCCNLFHKTCIKDIKLFPLQEDGLLVFCCKVCNNGEEFLRHIEIPWDDLLHLYMYNLSIRNSYQKYFHLIEEILPFILENQILLPISKQWTQMPQTELIKIIKTTLEERTDIFIKNQNVVDEQYYTLRLIGPPNIAKLNINPKDKLTYEFLTNVIKLPLHSSSNYFEYFRMFEQKDIYEFHSESEETSEDEIRCIEKVKKENPDFKENVEVIAKEQMENNKLNNENKMLPKNEKTSRKRKHFSLYNSCKELVDGTCSNRYNKIKTCDTSSDDNSSSSRSTSLDLIIPPPKNFLGANNPFLMLTPKKNTESNKQFINQYTRTNTVKNNCVVNIPPLDFSSKLNALNFIKAAGQPRTVRTIKRRLSAKDITIGPNQEVRRRRTRRLNTSVEVISTTTINPIHGRVRLSTKELLGAQSILQSSNSTQSYSTISSTQVPSTENISIRLTENKGSRRLRDRPQKSSNSRTFSTQTNQLNLKESVNKYFGVGNLFESGEKFSVHAKRLLPNGQTQYYIVFGENGVNSIPTSTST
ncbi:polycomb protein Pcl [Teleopsis dalmanni]|uniref:polycomb protein Pcl n=1 Tax=Teleopsis dalmanni TaxID=139649 RepID=UPI0018CD33FE|nr:polycomb protein Pcl [Teleopsis dalmanni]